MNVAVLVRQVNSQEVFIPLVMDRPIANEKYSIYHLQTRNRDFECALKIFPKDKRAQMAFIREMKIISSLSHENIVSYVQNMKFNNQAFDCSFLPIEYAPHGDFFDLIFAQELRNEKLIRTYFKQLVLGIEHLHSKGIAHLDLKLENILIGNDYLLKIADFDQSQILVEEKLLYRGSPSSRAPEVMENKCKDFLAADVYSMGVILYALATGDFPFLEKDGENGVTLAHYDLFCDQNEAFWDLRFGNRSDKGLFNDEFKELVSGMLAKDPAERWSIEDIQKSDWYNGEVLDKEELKNVMSLILANRDEEKRNTSN